MSGRVSQAKCTGCEITAEKRVTQEVAMSCKVNRRGASGRNKMVSFSSSVLMQLAVSEGDVQEMGRLVALYGATVVDEREPSGLFPAMRAVFEDQLQSLQFLVEAGADVTAQDNEGWTVLHVAAAMDNEDAARLVLDNSKENLTGLRDVEGKKPIDLAESVGMAALLLDAELFSRRDPDDLALTEVVQRSYEDRDAVVVSDVISIHPAYEDLLHLAMEKNYLLLLRYLLENNLIDPNTKDRNGHTPLYHAASRNNTEAGLLLAMHGASVRACDLMTHPNMLTICLLIVLHVRKN